MFWLPVALAMTGADEPTLAAYALRTENLDAPLALQTASPRLSWKLQATNDQHTNLSQSAYRILVASSPDLLTPTSADLWDSGRVTSSETYGIKYAGRPLGSRAHCWWRVQVWDQAGTISAWSPVAQFSTGLLKASDWQAEWIHGATPKAAENPLRHAQWIWRAGVTPGQAPAGSVTFLRSVDLAALPKEARAVLTADNLLRLRINGREVARTTDPEGWLTPVDVDLLAHLRVGENVIEIEVTNYEPGHAGLLGVFEFGDQPVVTDATWRAEGQPAQVLGAHGAAPWGDVAFPSHIIAPAQYLRKEFSMTKSVRRATVYATARGILDVHLNGKRVSDDLFAPGWTNYHKRVQFYAWDVTDQVRSDGNAIGAVLGQGWYAGYVAWGRQREHYGQTPEALVQLEIEFTDGTRQVVATDGSWRVGTGAILDEHFLHGEVYDARRAPTGWDEPGFAESWQPVGLGKKGDAILEAFIGNPVREYEELKPKSIQHLENGNYLIDFGQNLSGFVRLNVQEPRGTEIKLRHAERLDANGNLYTTNLRLAKAEDTYIAAGTGTETWNPRLTFHGFQYVEVSGLSQAPTAETVRAVAISSATPEVGTLETGNPMLNQLVSNAWWTQKMNFIDVPTDCPQRDERLGWTGDAQAYIRTAASYSDVQAFFTKWLVSLDDDQREDGQYPKVAPVLKGLDDGGPAWSEAGVICPMTIYDVYGDKELLRRHYPQMKRYVDFLVKRGKPDLLPPDNYHCYGDWLSINAEMPHDVIYMAYFAGSAEMVARAAEVLGETADAAHYRDLHQRIRAAFQRAYVKPDGRVEGNTQCSYVLALAFDLLDGAARDQAAQHLVADIESRGWHLSTGFVGTRDLMHVLSKIGRDDVAYRLLMNDTFPSWGFTIKHGATSIWERWDGWTPERGFQDPGMNSFAHYAYGAVVGWMFQHVGGIRETSPGFATVRIEPKWNKEVGHARTSFESVRGLIHTSWRAMGDRYQLTVVIPPNVRAEVVMPDGKTYEVGSGTWTYSCPLPQ